MSSSLGPGLTGKPWVPLVVALPHHQLLGVHISGQVPQLGPSTALFCPSSSSHPQLVLVSHKLVNLLVVLGWPWQRSEDDGDGLGRPGLVRLRRASSGRIGVEGELMLVDLRLEMH